MTFEDITPFIYTHTHIYIYIYNIYIYIYIYILLVFSCLSSKLSCVLTKFKSDGYFAIKVAVDAT